MEELPQAQYNINDFSSVLFDNPQSVIQDYITKSAVESNA